MRRDGNLVVELPLAMEERERRLVLARLLEILAVLAEQAGDLGRRAGTLIARERVVGEPLALLHAAEAEERESMLALLVDASPVSSSSMAKSRDRRASASASL